MRYFSIILVLIMVLSIVFTSFAKKEPVPITFWHSLDENGSKEMEYLVNEFNKEHTDIHVKATKFSSMNELKKSLYGGKYPDSALIDNRWQNELIDKGSLVPVEKYMQAIGPSIKVSNKLDLFKPIFDSGIQDNVLWTMAYICDTNVLLINKDFFQSLGIKKTPSGWFDLVTCSKPIMKSMNGRYGLSLPTDENPEELASFFMAFLRQRGGALLDNNGKVVLDSQESIDTLQFLSDLYNKYKVASVQVPPDAFFVGQVGMMFGDSRDYFRAVKQGMNVEALYTPKKNVRAAELELLSLAMFKSNPEKEKAAFNFIYWLQEFEQIRAFYIATSFVPVNKQVVASSGYFEFMNKNPGIRVFIKQLEWVKPLPNFDNYDEIMDYLGKSILSVFKGEKAPKNALEDVTKYAKSLLGQ